MSDLQQAPGVGPKLARLFSEAGVKSFADLKKADPEELYGQICTNQGYQVDRCVLYVCRCAAYFAKNKHHDAEKLKWWNWKD